MLLGVTGDQVLLQEVYAQIKAETLSKVRGTVQADILKEDQAQNTCIFSTEFSLRLMGDVQQYFIDQQVRNFYSVSISGYHIAEAGANPITQLALTLSNGFTYLEYYLSRGMNINDFAPNLSFFFSNGIDPEYAVIGRVARRIWAKALKLKYGANERAQQLKYHIQTSGRSLHAQEIDFNDIRTTLQALYAIYDNCNSLHTNAYLTLLGLPLPSSGGTLPWSGESPAGLESSLCGFVPSLRHSPVASSDQRSPPRAGGCSPSGRPEHPSAPETDRGPIAGSSLGEHRIAGVFGKLERIPHRPHLAQSE
jgi:hypothetical protein